MRLMTETEMELLQLLLDKAIQCHEIIVHIPQRGCGCAELSDVTSWCINGNSVQLDLEP